MKLCNFSFNALIVGSTKSGKTSFLVNLLCRPFCGMFYYMLIWPTFDNNKRPLTASLRGSRRCVTLSASSTKWNVGWNWRSCTLKAIFLRISEGWLVEFIWNFHFPHTRPFQLKIKISDSLAERDRTVNHLHHIRWKPWCSHGCQMRHAAYSIGKNSWTAPRGVQCLHTYNEGSSQKESDGKRNKKYPSLAPARTLSVPVTRRL